MLFCRQRVGESGGNEQRQRGFRPRPSFLLLRAPYRLTLTPLSPLPRSLALQRRPVLPRHTFLSKGVAGFADDEALTLPTHGFMLIRAVAVF